MKPHIKDILQNIPSLPGVYQFFNKEDTIIYIGKSVKLSSRVKSYFVKNAHLNFGKKSMVEEIERIEIIITNTAFESLLLETNLIKKYKPKYNILMKDDKDHSYIKITSELFPKVIRTRLKNTYTKKINEWYFGPYISGQYVENILKITKKKFGFRSCNIEFISNGNEFTLGQTFGRRIPCMDYYIKTCSAPCLLKNENISIYNEGIENIKNFLNGNYEDIIKNLQEKMKEYAKNLEFEKAGKVKKDIQSIQSIGEIQIISNLDQNDCDVIHFVEKYDSLYVSRIEIRNKKISGIYNHEVDKKIFNLNESIAFFIEQTYIENKTSLLLLLPHEIDSGEKQMFHDLHLKIEMPKIGAKHELLLLAYKNAYEYAYRKHLEKLSVKGFTKKDMIDLLKILGYKPINKNIIFECNDISHLSGNYTVASRSVIENGKPNPSKYRKFKIQSVEKGEINDFGSLKEIMKRRLKEIQKQQTIPDLIIIDGGKGQLSSVMNIIDTEKKILKYNEDNEINEYIKLLDSLQIISIAKKEEELFLPYLSESIKIDKNSAMLRLIQKLRDEAHRFAITFNRDKRTQAMKKNILEELPGIGPKTRQKLLKQYGSVEKIIHDEILEKILTKKQIETLQNHNFIN